MIVWKPQEEGSIRDIVNLQRDVRNPWTADFGPIVVVLEIRRTQIP